MTQNKAILVATIGTRDLAFCCEDYDQQWLNVGNDRNSDINKKDSQAIKVQYQLGIQDSFRNITKHLSDNWEEYEHKLKPIIIGKLIEDKKDLIKTVYLVVTDQSQTSIAKFYEKDTIYSGQIIKKYLEANYNFEVKIFYQGNEKDSTPSNFEQMFTWWQKFWDIIDPNKKNNQNLLLCLKGGVNQSSEAARITSIIRFEEKVIFYDFEEKEALNLQGIPSPYTAPFKGINYLWNRKQNEALSLLDRYDYEAVNIILQPYYQDNNNEDIRKLKLWLEKAIKWNNADFETFISGLKQIPTNNWWWKGYESAYLGLMRLKQGNNIEAFFHAFRGIEGLMSELIITKYQSHTPKNKLDLYDTPRLKSTVCKDGKHPEFKSYEYLFINKKDEEIRLYGSILGDLVKIALPTMKNDQQWNKFFNYTQKKWRNELYHRLIPLSVDDLFKAWEVKNQQEWKNKILSLLNCLSEQNYSSLEKASLMAEYHRKIKESIEKYHP